MRALPHSPIPGCHSGGRERGEGEGGSINSQLEIAELHYSPPAHMFLYYTCTTIVNTSSTIYIVKIENKLCQLVLLGKKLAKTVHQKPLQLLKKRKSKKCNIFIHSFSNYLFRFLHFSTYNEIIFAALLLLEDPLQIFIIIIIMQRDDNNFLI